MDYREVLQKLYKIAATKKVHLGLESIGLAHSLFGRPAESYPIIHIAGTNGKGSVATKLSEILTISGYRVGLYTSPHIHSYRERIQIKNQCISESAIVHLLPEIFTKLSQKNISLTFFEYTTMLSWIYFQINQVDIAIMETGLGGRLDATNLINPILSVITTISLDHTEYLGLSISDIAREKAGIIKPGIPVVLGPKAQHYYISKEARLKISPIVYVPKSITGFFDDENQQIVRACLPFLSKSYSLTKDNIEKAIGKQPPCRFQLQTYKGKLWVFDVAHNKEALESLTIALVQTFPGKSLRFLVNFSFHKDILGCLQVITDIARYIHIIPSSHVRIAPVQYIAKCLEELRYRSYSSSHQNIAEAVSTAMESEELLVVTGSFYIMSEIQKELGIFDTIPDPLALSEIF
ncbi:MAG: bifunctional folylpolyglutamate synthase/dihydrofolate synthase [Chlamydiales bacterium]